MWRQRRNLQQSEEEIAQQHGKKELDRFEEVGDYWNNKMHTAEDIYQMLISFNIFLSKAVCILRLHWQRNKW